MPGSWADACHMQIVSNPSYWNVLTAHWPLSCKLGSCATACNMQDESKMTYQLLSCKLEATACNMQDVSNMSSWNVLTACWPLSCMLGSCLHQVIKKQGNFLACAHSLLATIVQRVGSSAAACSMQFGSKMSYWGVPTYGYGHDVSKCAVQRQFITIESWAAVLLPAIYTIKARLAAVVSLQASTLLRYDEVRSAEAIQIEGWHHRARCQQFDAGHPCMTLHEWPCMLNVLACRS
eukprot:1059372-Pelagomonas_calceolata.AAC.5